MKLGFVVPGGVDRPGGTEVIPALLGLLQSLAKRHDVRVVVATREPTPGTYERDGFVVVELPAPSTTLGLNLASRAPRVIAALGRCDVVHGFWAGHTGALAVLAGRALGAKVVVSVGGGEPVWLPDIAYGSQGSLRGRSLFRFSIRGADAITYGSRYVGCVLPSHPRRFKIPLGASREIFEQEPSRSAERRVTVVANKNRVKDPNTALRAIGQIVRFDPAIRVDWIGMDTLDGQVERAAEAMGIDDHIRFVGQVATHDMPAHYARGRVLLQSSRFESQGVAVLEAAMAGVPTVGTEVGLVHELAPQAATAVCVGDDRALAQGVLTLFRDERRRLTLGRRARDWALAHDLAWTTRQFEALYRSL